MTYHIPDEVLSHHIAILGKTGSGKTSTSKLAVEQVVAANYRVCILDPVKSDWWGITSSADGKRPGLPFKILGGPHGHVPLHSSAGKAIGQLVGSGKLPLSIIDMADFEAGGLQKFFPDFAQGLMRSARGVIHLVIEEAHEFAPKERAGFSAENMAIHWAKKLATAGRTKGIRLIVATQRTQALHNAILGSCETVIAHRLTAPADQEPVLKWLKANASKEIVDRISQDLSSLPTGTGWICSGEAKVFEQVRFPKFKTYDNTATPTGDDEAIEVETAPVNQDELRAIIGDALKDAEANDPKALKAEIARLRKEGFDHPKIAPIGQETLDRVEANGYERGYKDGRNNGMKEGSHAQFRRVVEAVGNSAMLNGDQDAMEAFKLPQIIIEVPKLPKPTPPGRPVEERRSAPNKARLSAPSEKNSETESGSVVIDAGMRKLLDVLVQSRPHALPSEWWGAFAISVPSGGSWNARVKRLRDAGLIVAESGRFKPTQEGIAESGMAQMADSDEASLWTVWNEPLRDLIGPVGVKLLEVLSAHHRYRITSNQWGILADRTDSGGSWNGAVKALRDWLCIDLINGGYRVTEKGFALLGAKPEAVDTRDALYKARKSGLSSGAARLFDVWKEGITRAELAGEAGLKMSGGYWNGAFKELLDSGLISENNGALVTLTELFQ